MGLSGPVASLHHLDREPGWPGNILRCNSTDEKDPDVDATQSTGDAQAKHWNEVAGPGWVAAQPTLDRMFKPFDDLLLAAVPAGFAGQVLDVGCGTGSTTLAVARVLGASGACTGIDVSAPMLTAARARAERENAPATFIRADAQRHAFAPARFDLLLSRFGVMFFDDVVQALANLRRAASERAALRFIVWRSAAENPFMTVAERAVAPFLPSPPPRAANAPGQFAFADRAKVVGILTDSGWTGIDIRPVDVACAMPEAELIGYFTRVGPLTRALPAIDEQARAPIVATVRAAFDPYVFGAEVRFSAGCWIIDARAA